MALNTLRRIRGKLSSIRAKEKKLSDRVVKLHEKRKSYQAQREANKLDKLRAKRIEIEAKAKRVELMRREAKRIEKAKAKISGKPKRKSQAKSKGGGLLKGVLRDTIQLQKDIIKTTYGKPNKKRKAKKKRRKRR